MNELEQAKVDKIKYKMDSDNDGMITPDEFILYQNRKWLYRRLIALSCMVFYFVVGASLIYYVEAANVENYTGLFVQISLFCGGIIGAYFTGSSFEEVKMDRDKILNEFLSIKQLAEKMKTK